MTTLYRLAGAQPAAGLKQRSKHVLAQKIPIQRQGPDMVPHVGNPDPGEDGWKRPSDIGLGELVPENRFVSFDRHLSLHSYFNSRHC